MKTYIGSKIILAEPMTDVKFYNKYRHEMLDTIDSMNAQPGYHVQYPDGYDSWSPKKVFEEAYREVSENEAAFFSQKYD